MKLSTLAILFSMACGSIAHADEPAPADPAGPDDKPPVTDEPWRERIAVTAEVSGGDSGPPGSTSTVLDPEVGTVKPTTVTDLVARLPGVAENGQGGLFQGFSIRGVARQRVMSLVSGMRIASERRAGATVTFVDPLLMGSVEVLQGPSSTFHGSGALGGVVQVFPREFETSSFYTGYDSNGDENYQVFGTGGEGWSVGLARRDANDGEAPDGTVLNSHFTQYSGIARFSWGDGPRRYEVLYIPSYGEDIGKANSDFPERTTEYPLERHQMFKFAVESEKGWRTHAYLQTQDLETEITEDDERSRVFNESLEYGLRWERESAAGGKRTLRWGLETVGRAGVDATERSEDLEGGVIGEPTKSLDDATELEAGGFASLKWDWTRTRLEAGTRLSWQGQENGDADVDNTAVNAFVGMTRDLGSNFELAAGASSGTRFPSLSELFFTGKTGRGDVIGNPDLDAERSLSLEASLRWTGKSLLLKGIAFHNSIDEYIERVELSEDLLTFVNLTSGTIEGIEIHGMAIPSSRWIVTFGGHIIEGRDNDDRPLSDVPPDELFVGFDHRFGPWSVDARWTHRADKSDPGSGEQSIPSAELLSAGLTWRITDAWTVAVSGSNLLDEEYTPSADRKATLAPGRRWAIRWIWRNSS